MGITLNTKLIGRSICWKF